MERTVLHTAFRFTTRHCVSELHGLGEHGLARRYVRVADVESCTVIPFNKIANHFHLDKYKQLIV